MPTNTVYHDEYLKIFTTLGEVYIETFKSGFALNKLTSILSSHPEIGVTDISSLRKSINSAPSQPKVFGELKERIDIEISQDGLKATAIFNLPAEELNSANRRKLMNETMSVLREKGITFGIKSKLFNEDISPGKIYTIAEGIPPEDGKDSEIIMYQLSDTTPHVGDDGKVDFYELKLINMVKTGDWLGERIESTEGIPGRTVRDEILPPRKGKNYPLSYDRTTVKEIFELGKTILYSRVNGAVAYDNGKISVSNFLEIDGDVDISTGNIKFDGYVVVKGTVSDGFSVEATKDIEINGDLGLGNVKSITSTGGSIYIKGGIASRSEVKINAKKNIYTKFLDNAVITCEGAAHIGYYSINSFISAREVIFDSIKGHIIGGHIKAVFRVSTPIIGSEIEKKTCVEVTGFDRSALVGSLESILIKIEELKKEKLATKQKLAYYEDLKTMDVFQRKTYTGIMEDLFEINESIRNCEEERKSLTGLLKTRGEGEISITKKAFPNCSLIIKTHMIQTTANIPPTIYFVHGDELKQV